MVMASKRAKKEKDILDQILDHIDFRLNLIGTIG